MTTELRLEPTAALGEEIPSFHDPFVGLFNAHFPRLYRFLDRLTGDPELAADLAQETFVKLYQRGAAPDRPEAWLITVAMNLFRNVRTTEHRRQRLLVLATQESPQSDPAPMADQEALSEESRSRVRWAIDRLPERDRRLLLLQAEGYSYRDIAVALELNEVSIGTLLARARRAFREIYKDACDAS